VQLLEAAAGGGLVSVAPVQVFPTMA